MLLPPPPSRSTRALADSARYPITINFAMKFLPLLHAPIIIRFIRYPPILLSSRNTRVCWRMCASGLESGIARSNSTGKSVKSHGPHGKTFSFAACILCYKQPLYFTFSAKRHVEKRAMKGKNAHISSGIMCRYRKCVYYNIIEAHRVNVYMGFSNHFRILGRSIGLIQHRLKVYGGM